MRFMSVADDDRIQGPAIGPGGCGPTSAVHRPVSVAPPPVVARVARRDALAREEFVGAAREVIESHGFQGFSLERVGQRVGVRKQAVHHYFHAKEAVLFEVAVAQHTEVALMVDRAVAATGGAADAVEALLRTHFGAYRSRLRLFQLCHTVPPMFDLAGIADAALRVRRLHRRERAARDEGARGVGGRPRAPRGRRAARLAGGHSPRRGHCGKAFAMSPFTLDNPVSPPTWSQPASRS